MRIEDYNSLMEFFLIHSTLKASQDNTIMEVFGYFVNRDMILEASTMQLLQEVNAVDTLVEEEEILREEIDTESFLHDNLDFDTLSNAEVFYTKYEGKGGTDVYFNFSKKYRFLHFDFYRRRCKTKLGKQKLDDLKIFMPTNFEELEQYKDGYLL